MRAIGFSIEADGYTTNDLSIYSPHLFKNHTLRWWAYAQEPNSILWAGRGDGKLLAFTWQQEQQVWGWTLCETDGEVLHGCVVSEDGQDRLYITVRRIVAGQARVFIERMATWDWGGDQREACFLDSSRAYFAETPTRSFGKLWHLEGAEVAALADGHVIRGLVVQNGRVTLPQPATFATIGLPYEARVETLAPQRLANGRRQSPKNGRLRLLDTRGIEVGAREDWLFPIKERDTEEYGEPTRLQNGIVEHRLAPIWSDESTVIIKSADPLPMEILGVFYDDDANA